MLVADVHLERAFGLEHDRAHGALELLRAVVRVLVTSKLGRSAAGDLADLRIKK